LAYSVARAIAWDADRSTRPPSVRRCCSSQSSASLSARALKPHSRDLP